MIKNSRHYCTIADMDPATWKLAKSSAALSGVTMAIWMKNAIELYATHQANDLEQTTETPRFPQRMKISRG